MFICSCLGTVEAQATGELDAVESEARGEAVPRTLTVRQNYPNGPYHGCREGPPIREFPVICGSHSRISDDGSKSETGKGIAVKDRV